MDLVDERATTSMEVGWYQKMSGVKHTGIVVVINGKPRYTIDFEGNVNVHEWEDRNRRIHGMFIHIPFELKIMQKLQPNQHTTQGRNARAKHFISIVVISKANKDLANNILKDIQKIKMGPYNATSNNCRHHVVRVYHMLVGKRGLVSHSFNIKMKEIWDEDNMKITAEVGAFGGVGSVISSVGAGVLGSVVLPFSWPIVVPLAGVAGFLAFIEVGVGLVYAVSKSSKSFGKKIQSCVVRNSKYNASPGGLSWNAQLNNFHCSFGYNANLLLLNSDGVFKGCDQNRRYSRYFQQVHGSSRIDGYDNDMTHFFIIPPNIGINNENVEEILHDMLMMGMAPSTTGVSDEDIDEVYWNEINGCRYCLVLRQVFQDFGRQLTSDCRVLVFKTTDLIHSEDYNSEAEIISFDSY